MYQLCIQSRKRCADFRNIHEESLLLLSSRPGMSADQLSLRISLVSRRGCPDRR